MANPFVSSVPAATVGRMTSNSSVAAAAERAAQQLLQSKVELVKALAEAVEAEQPVKDVLAAIRTADYAVVPGYGQDELAAARGNVEKALAAARSRVQDARRAALAGGWTQADLIEVGLVKPRAPRKRQPASTAAEKNSDQPSPQSDSAVAAESA